MNEAQRNLEALRNNPYPGRGIIVGMDETGRHLAQVYWIMGRSPNSRNRIFAHKSGTLWTEAADPSKVSDPSLIIYHAMREHQEHYVVTNGDQTDTIVETLEKGGDFRRALMTRTYEPDAPNFTPRISAICTLGADGPTAELSLLKKSPFGDGCDRHFFCLEQFGKGLGHFIATYTADGNPLPAFRGEPILMPLAGDPQTVAKTLWDALNADNRVALAVKFIELQTARSALHVINKYPKIG